MYANKLSVATNEKEAFLRFQMVTPEYDDNDNVKGSKVADETTIVLSLEGLSMISEIINKMIGEIK